MTRIPPLSSGGGVAVQGSGTNVVSNQTVQFSASNGVTFGLSGSTMTASVGHTGPVAIKGSGTSVVTNGTVQYANSNGITFGLSGSTVTASHNGLTLETQTFVGGIAGSAASTVTNGTVQFQTSPTVTFGLAGSVMTASAAGGGAAAPNMSIWANWDGGAQAFAISRATRPGFYPLNHLNPMPGAMSLDALALVVTAATSGTTVDSHTITFSLGLYGLSNSTKISLMNSVSFSVGLAASANSYQSLYGGTRFLVFDSSAWSSAPVVTAGGSYWVGMIVATSGVFPNQGGGNGPSLQGRSPAGFVTNYSGRLGGATQSSNLYIPFLGEYTTSSAALPSGVGLSEISITNNTGHGGMIPTVFMAQGVSWL